MNKEKPDIHIVKNFWNHNICHVNFLEKFEMGSQLFFEESENLRYHYHYYLLPLFNELARKYNNGELLEVGCSMGTDLNQLARRNFRVTGIDLTEAGIKLAHKRFLISDHKANLIVADAENMPFADNTFNVVYSFGVIHHTPDPGRALQEIWRVLKKDGEAVIMLYHRHSLNYLAHKILGIPTDGSRSDPVPIAYTYTKKEIYKLFSNFADVTIRIEYLFGTGWGFVNRLFPVFLHRFLGKHIGWHIIIRALK